LTAANWHATAPILDKLRASTRLFVLLLTFRFLDAAGARLQQLHVGPTSSFELEVGATVNPTIHRLTYPASVGPEQFGDSEEATRPKLAKEHSVQQAAAPRLRLFACPSYFLALFNY